MEKKLQLIGVNKYYKLSNKETFHALYDVNVEFEKGELVSIVGESGSGKSTLMNLIGGLDSDFSGQIIADGEHLENLTDKELDKYRKNKIGFVFQSFNLIPHLSILDNVTLALTLSNVSEKEKIERATKMLKLVGLESQLKKSPNQLSGGQKQRVAIARALIIDPEIIIADEPTGALHSDTS
ncbi:MAG: ABC transporter ATP-binding protein, partial [Clostridia bacterium]|nr:ABC transporter ATP-binding protein [Clostridia bacterium]